MASYKGTYSNEQSLNYVIPIMVMLFLGIVYIMSQRSGLGFVSFILIGTAAVTMIYWVMVLKKMTKDQKPKYAAREQETKSWVYDLIKGDEEIIFVALANAAFSFGVISGSAGGVSAVTSLALVSFSRHSFLDEP